MNISSYKPRNCLDNKHLLTLLDYSGNEICEILKQGLRFKNLLKQGKKHTYLKGKTLAMVFSKSSTRTRVSFEQGIRQLGGTPIFLSANDIQLGRGETIADTVRTLGRYNIDGIMIRTFKQSDLVDLAKYGNMPIINGLTDDFHPCQALADYLTVYELFGKTEGLKLTYFGDPNNVSNSLMIAGAKLGVNICICCPKPDKVDAELLEKCKKFGIINVVTDPYEAALNADVIYTDVFFSMGQEIEAKKRKALAPYMVTSEIMSKANKNAIFMHCLPAHRGEEVTDEVIESAQSVVFEQAENRLHAQKAVMYLLMKD